MGQDMHAIKAGLERELAGYEQSGKTDRAKLVKAELVRVNKIIKAEGGEDPIETAVEEPAETPEAAPAKGRARAKAKAESDS